MPFKFDNSISWMDIGTLVSAVAFVSGAFFALNGEIQLTSDRVQRNTDDIAKQQMQTQKANSRLAEQLERNRLEQKADNHRIEQKLDDLIKRLAR